MNGGILLEEPVKSRLEQCNSLPSLPAVAARVVELGRDSGASMKDVAEVVTSDPALAAKVLRMANSPLYARRRKCANFQEALVLLGLNATLTLALTFSLVTNLRTNERKGLGYGRLRRRSLLAATAARVVAQHLESRHADDAFLCGLLQDIGLLALDRACPDLYGGLSEVEQGHERIISLETERLGCDHARIGAWLLERWNIHERLRHVVVASHDTSGWSSEIGIDDMPLAHAVSLSGPIADLWMASTPETAVETLRFAASQKEDLDAGADSSRRPRPGA